MDVREVHKYEGSTITNFSLPKQEYLSDPLSSYEAEEAIKRAHLVSCAKLLIEDEFPGQSPNLTIMPKSSAGALLVRTENKVIKFTFRATDVYEKYIDHLAELSARAGAIHAYEYGIVQMKEEDNPLQATPSYACDVESIVKRTSRIPVTFMKMEYIPGIPGSTFLRQNPELRDQFEETVGELLAGIHSIPAFGNDQRYEETKKLEQEKKGSFWSVRSRRFGNRGYTQGKFMTNTALDSYPQELLLEEDFHKFLEKENSPVRIYRLGNVLEGIKRLGKDEKWTRAHNLPSGVVLNHRDPKPDNFLVCTQEEWKTVKETCQTKGYEKQIGERNFVFFSLDYDLSGPYSSLFGELGELIPQQSSEAEQKRTIRNIVRGHGMRDYEDCLDMLHTIGLAVHLEILWRRLAFADMDEHTSQVSRYLKKVEDLHREYPDLEQRFLGVISWINKQLS